MRDWALALTAAVLGYAVSFAVGVVAGMTIDHNSSAFFITILCGNFGSILVTLAAVGAIRPERRWACIGLTLLFLWLFGLSNIALGYTTIMSWLISIVPLALVGGVGGLFSMLFGNKKSG